VPAPPPPGNQTLKWPPVAGRAGLWGHRHGKRGGAWEKSGVSLKLLQQIAQDDRGKFG